MAHVHGVARYAHMHGVARYAHVHGVARYFLLILSRQIHRIIGRDDKAIHSISVSPAGNTLALPGHTPRHTPAFSRRRFPGNHGVVTLLNAATRSSIGSVTCNGSVRACSFTSDGSKLLCSGNEGLVCDIAAKCACVLMVL